MSPTAKVGLTSTYTGTRHGDQVGGEYTSSWPGHWDQKSGNWYATVEQPVSPPPVMHACGANCFTLTFANGKYTITSPRNSWDPPDFTSVWTVESFTREPVILHRHDSPNDANPASKPNGWDVV